ncbi:hypothetical protein ACLEJQ_09965 [Pseudomonas sp. SMV71]|uniref:hypothetical protein n=1 Tax=Pseudomonas sp. SMV71 TaxID=3390195 RepID=UPI003F83BAC9
MEFTRHQLTAHHGIIFCITRFTVMPSDRGRLGTLYFQEAKAAHFDVTRLLVELYDKMLARDLPCVMSVAISRPLTRKQGDTLNDQRTDVINITTGFFTGVTGQVPVVGLAIAPVAGYIGRRWAKGILPTYHAGDVIVSLDAQVSGGIGPQRSMSSMIIQS